MLQERAWPRRRLENRFQIAVIEDKDGCVYNFRAYARTQRHTRLTSFAMEPHLYREQPFRELKLHVLLVTGKTSAA
jgi:hypothetical protein